MPTGYHHGSLRETLLDEARGLLRESGLEGLSLRELARRAGVSHAAPRRHFADRDALVAALAARGFEELTADLERAAGDGDPRSRMAAYADAHVRFSLANPALMALMFSVKSDSAEVSESAERFFTLGAELLGDSSGPAPYLVAATLEGISALIAAGRLAPDRVDEVVAAAVDLLLPLTLG